jgi:hypothetical protein
MRKHNFLRSVLAMSAVLAVAGPGMVLAGDGLPGYAPKILQLLGPSSVPKGTNRAYTARVTFTNNQVVDFTGDPVVFSAARGSFSGNVYTAPGDTGRDSLKGVITNEGVTATGTKIINVTP